MNERNDYSNRPMIAQSTTTIGTLKTKPRAKLRLEGRLAAASDCASLILMGILTMVSSLPPLGGIGHTFKTRGGPIRLQAPRRDLKFASSAASPRNRNAALDLIALLFFSVCRDEQRQREAYDVILLGHIGRLRPRPGWACRIAIFLLAISGTRAFAQEANVETPTQLLEPEAGDGIRVGHSFVLHSEATGEAKHDTNVYNVDRGQSPDTVFSLRPTLRLVSDFPRHRIQISGTGELRRYAKFTGENSETGELSAAGLAELAGAINVDLAVSIARGIEQRGSVGDQFLTDTPISFKRHNAFLKVSRVEHRLEFTVTGNIEQLRYNNTTTLGVPIDLSDRDFTKKTGAVRFDLRLGGRLAVFAEIDGNSLTYNNAIASQRNSSGTAVLAGTRFRVTNLIDFEAAAGYLHQSFDHGPFKPVKALNYRLTANWTPRPTWLIKAGVERSIDASPRADTPAIFTTSYKLSAQHATSNRLLISGALVYQREAYQSINRTDRRIEANAAAEYRLTPRIGIIASAGYRDQAGGPLARKYHGAIAALALRVVA